MMILFKVDVKVYVCFSCINCLFVIFNKCWGLYCILLFFSNWSLVEKIYFYFIIIKRIGRSWNEVIFFLKKFVYYNLNVV